MTPAGILSDRILLTLFFVPITVMVPPPTALPSKRACIPFCMSDTLVALSTIYVSGAAGEYTVIFAAVLVAVAEFECWSVWVTTQ